MLTYFSPKATFSPRPQHLDLSVPEDMQTCLIRLNPLATSANVNFIPMAHDLTRLHVSKRLWMNTEVEITGHLQQLADGSTGISVTSQITRSSYLIWAAYALSLCAGFLVMPTFASRFGETGLFFAWPFAIWAALISASIAHCVWAKWRLTGAFIRALIGK